MVSVLIALSVLWWNVFTLLNNSEEYFMKQVIALKDTQNELALDIRTLSILIKHERKHQRN